MFRELQCPRPVKILSTQASEIRPAFPQGTACQQERKLRAGCGLTSLETARGGCERGKCRHTECDAARFEDAGSSHTIIQRLSRSWFNSSCSLSDLNP